jgi:hypothetical protein
LDSIGRAFAVEVDLESVRALENSPLVANSSAPIKFPAKSSQDQQIDIQRILSGGRR